MESISGFGITLQPLTEEWLETVRQWRNQTHVSQFMEFQATISPSEQLTWFKNITNAYYFIILSENTPVGLIDIKKIDASKKLAETGLFIGNQAFVGSGVTIGASILLLDFAFNTLLLENVTAKINNNNQAALQYNQFLGFEKTDQNSTLFSIWKLQKSTYIQQRAKLMKIVG
jgi:RimJ/RimL family protein N-acetyltransferase